MFLTTLFAFISLLSLTFLTTHKIKKSLFTFKRKPPQTNPKLSLGLSYEDVYFVNSTGSKLHGWFVPAPGYEGEQRGCVVLTAGWTLNADYLLPLVIHINSSLGYHCFLHEPRFHGLSEGDSTGYMNVFKAGEDVKSALKYVAARDDVDAKKIGCIGFSMGAGASIRAAHADPLVKFVVAIGSFSNFDRMLAEGHKRQGLPPIASRLLLWYAQKVVGFSYRTVSPYHLLPEMDKHMPLLFAHGVDDVIVSFSNYQEIKSLAQKLGLTRWHGVEVPQAKHMNVIVKDHFLTELNSFLNNVVKPHLESN